MPIKSILTPEDYASALKEVEADWDTSFQVGSSESERYAALLTSVEAYEAEHFPLPDPDAAEGGA